MPLSHTVGGGRGARSARFVGWSTIVLSIAGLVAGLVLVNTLSTDVRSSVSVSQSALEAISQTIEAVDDVAANTSASLESAATSVEGVSATVDGAALAIEDVAGFLDEDLPETLESVQMSLPAAIQAANAIDGTLRALSLFGVDYNPDEPFGESLSRVNTALASLPDELRSQSIALRLLIPSVGRLGADSKDLASSMSDLTSSLAGFADLTDDYRVTIDQAQTTIDRTTSSVDSSLLLIRLLIVGAGVVGAGIGVALVSMGRTMEWLVGLAVDERTVETVEIG